MRCILENWNRLYKLLQVDVAARKRREQKRLCPEPKLVRSTATTMEFTWWHTSEEWDPIPGCTYQLCLRLVNPELDDGIGQMDLNGFNTIYTGRDSGCIVRDLMPGTVYQCRLKAVFGTKKAMPERSLPGYGGYKTSFPQPVTKFQRSLYGYDFNDTRPIQNNRPGSNVSF